MPSVSRLFPAFFVALLATPLYAFTAASTCPDTSAALTPAPLEAAWAVEWWMPRHEQKFAEEGRENAELLLIGDSITHGWEDDGNEVWETYFAGIETHNIGFSGDRTENVLWRFEHSALDGLSPKLTVLMIGTNNTGHRQDPAECTVQGIETILDEIEQRLPKTNVLLLSIFPRSPSPDDELRQLNNEINHHIEKFDAKDHVTFLDINDIFLDDEGRLPEEIMPDFLHPNEQGYELWAQKMKPVILDMLQPEN